jgi:hypothetical protein
MVKLAVTGSTRTRLEGRVTEEEVPQLGVRVVATGTSSSDTDSKPHKEVVQTLHGQERSLSLPQELGIQVRSTLRERVLVLNRGARTVKWRSRNKVSTKSHHFLRPSRCYCREKKKRGRGGEGGGRGGGHLKYLP